MHSMAKILVVDDEPQVRVMLKEMLLVDNHEVLEAENGKQGGEVFVNEKCDLLITDLVMPGKNGIDLIIELKEIYNNTRIIAISGGGGLAGRFDYLVIAKLMGVQVAINKPFSLDEIRRAVQTVLN